ncbi:MAG: tetratricopeptide repeat protein [Candidatus Scalinduaceae bacterium]
MEETRERLIEKGHVIMCNRKIAMLKNAKLVITGLLLFVVTFMYQASVYSQPLLQNNCIKALEYGAVGELDKARLQFEETLDSSSHCEYAKGGMELLSDVFDGKVSRKVAIHIFKAWVHDSNGEFKEMAAEGEKAIRLDPNYSPGYNVRGAAYGLLGEFDKAIRDIDRSLLLTPNDPVSYNARGLAKKAKGDIKGALADFNHAIKLGYTEAYVGRTAIYMMTGEFKKGFKEANRAVELNPNMAESWSARAFFQGALGYTNGAKEDIKKALSINPENPEVWFIKAAIHDMAGEKAATIKAMRKFLKVALPMMSAQINFVRQKLRKLEAD